jgi:hypothetical protein
MNRTKPMKTFTSAGFLLMAILSSCRSDTLIPLGHEAPATLRHLDVEANFCTSPRTPAIQKIKYLFIIDHSQSNKHTSTSTVPGDTTNTDPDGRRRYGQLLHFLRDLADHPNQQYTSFSAIKFNDNVQEIPFTNNRENFITLLRQSWIGSGTESQPSPVDNGFTNYMAALNTAFGMLEEDAEEEAKDESENPPAIQYQLIFVSDGIPVVQNGTQTLTQTIAQLGPIIDALMNLKNNVDFGHRITGIAINTVYYYRDSPIPAAQDLLRQMSDRGTGQYLEVSGSNPVSYQSFAPPVRNVRANLSDVWIENENTVAWEDGRILPDFDGDGLPDPIEGSQASNYAQSDSDGNGVSDLVEYRLTGSPCKSSGCAPSGRETFSICDGYLLGQGPQGSVRFKSSSKDGLNDCEKWVLGATVSSFDSNGDFIPDLLALKNSIPYIPGTSGAHLNPYGEPMNLYTKLKLGFPIGMDSRNLPGFKSQENRLLHKVATSDQDCYTYSAKNVAVLRVGDRIRVSIIENESVIGNKPTLRVASKVWSGGVPRVRFDATDFE